MHKKQTSCRIGGGDHLIEVLNLGNQALTGVFPKPTDPEVSKGPLELVWCPESGLLQLAHSFDPGEMYGENYGYRSGLNRSMVQHLHNKVMHLLQMQPVGSGDLVIDIGSNDGTLLRAYEDTGARRIGIDPTGNKFRQYYPEGVELIPDFFSKARIEEVVPGARAKIVTAISMFYDLDDPIAFAREVHDILDDDGIWHFEQSYMPSMLRLNSYDTVCHEHVSYYSLGAIQYILDKADMKIADVVMNAVNGGSFAVTAVRKNSKKKCNTPVIEWLLSEEHRMGLHTPRPFRNFEERVFQHRKSLVSLIEALNNDGKKVFGYGASTKGNVVLQFCGFDATDIPCIAEVNEDKFGCITPGTEIPIVSEAEARAQDPDYLLVLPWHFKAGILEREREFLAKGGHLIFPFPEIEIV